MEGRFPMDTEAPVNSSGLVSRSQIRKATRDKALAKKSGRFSKARIQKRGFPSWFT